MSIYNVTKSSYPLFDQGLALRNEESHKNLAFSEISQEKKQCLQLKVPKAGVPYEFWMIAQSPWKPLLASAESNSEKNGVEQTVSVLEDAGNIMKEDREFAVKSLFAEKTSCTYPFETEEGELSTLTYFTFYEKDRIYCVKEGSGGYEWEMLLEDETRYEKVMSFLNSLKDKENLGFASHENFWQDYLSGELDIEGFQDFLDTKVQKGIPNYAYVMEESVYFDKESVHFSKYVDQPFCKLIATTREELMDWYKENVINKREKTLAETNPVEYHYRTFGGRGQKLYYYKGKHYTFEEYYPLDLRDANEALAKAGNLIEDGWSD